MVYSFAATIAQDIICLQAGKGTEVESREENRSEPSSPMPLTQGRQSTPKIQKNPFSVLNVCILTVHLRR